MNTDWKTFLSIQDAFQAQQAPFPNHPSAGDSCASRTMVPLTEYGIVQVTGKDSDKFLQGQLTCDIRELDGTRTGLFAYCNTKGRITASGWILRNGEAFWLILPQAMVSTLIQIMDKYAKLSRIQLSDISTQYPLLELIGTPERPLPFPSDVYQAQAWQEGWILKLPSNTSRYWVINTPTYLINLWQELQASFQIGNSAHSALQDIEAGIAHIHPQTAESFTPHMLNYPELGAVSFRKGCYLGQEIIARAHYLGRTKRLLKKMELESSTKPNVGDLLYNEQNEEVGNIAEIVALSENHYRGLMVVQETALEKPVYFKQFQVKIL